MFVTTATSPSLVTAARAETNEATTENIGAINQRALERFSTGKYQDARQLLKKALRLCNTPALAKDPIKARTHVNMGVVLLAGFGEKQMATAHFRQAVQIQPDIAITAALFTPELASAFKEASGSSAAPTAAATAAPSTASAPVAAATPEPPVAAPVASTAPARKPSAPTKHPPAPAAAPAPQPAPQTAPPPATAQEQADAQDAQEERSAASRRYGTMPFSEPPQQHPQRSRPDTSVVSAPRRWHVYLAVTMGTGVGYVVGKTETLKLSTSSGPAVAEKYHVAPELGIYASDSFFVSAMGRFQSITSVNVTQTADGTPRYKSAAAGFLKLTWVASRLGLRPFFNLAVGGGTIRHVVKFPNMFACGPNGNETCIDNVAATGFMVGPGVGFYLDLGKNLHIVAAAQALLIAGPGRTTVNADGTVGLALSL